MHIQDEDFTKNRMHTTDVKHIRSKLNLRLHVQQTLLLIKRFSYLQYNIWTELSSQSCRQLKVSLQIQQLSSQQQERWLYCTWQVQVFFLYPRCTSEKKPCDHTA